MRGFSDLTLTSCLPNRTAVRCLLLALLGFSTGLLPGFVAHAASEPPIAISSVSASFLPNTDDSGAFTATPATAVAFTQEFPGINFNTPPGTVTCSNPSGISVTSRPFTSVAPQPDGSCKTTVAQGNNQQAGMGDLASFQAVFTGAFVVSAAGQVTFNFYSDDGWILSIGPSAEGAQPSNVSGPMLNFPKSGGPFTGYAVVGSYNVKSSPNQNNLVVSFPAAGRFPFELDYSECCAGDLALTVMANGTPIPPATQLALEVSGIANAQKIQGKQHLDVVVAAGQAQQVELFVDGRSRGISRSAPFAFDWDTSQETPGQHKVVFRGMDTAGGITDKEVTLEVLGAAPAPAAPQPTVAPTPVAAPPPAAASNTNSGPLLAVGTVLLLILAGAGLYFMMRGVREPAVAAAPVESAPPPVTEPPKDDKTEFIGRGALSDLTMVSVRRPQVLPTAKLLVKPDREIVLSRSGETVLGRDNSNAAVIDDRQVSRQHARIVCSDGDFWVEDLNSTNGTRVNGERIEKHKLANNDQIGLGDTIVTFSVESSQ